MKIIANRQLHGDYGTLLPEEEADLSSDLAQDLVKRGLARVPELETQDDAPAETPSLKIQNKGKK